MISEGDVVAVVSHIEGREDQGWGILVVVVGGGTHLGWWEKREDH